jgi:hypothetical protein
LRRSPQPPHHQRTKVSILTKKAMTFATAVAPLLVRGTLLRSPTSRQQSRAAALPPPAIPLRAAGSGGLGSHLHESYCFSPRGTSLPPRRQRASCCDNSRSPSAPLPPGPLAPRHVRDHVLWGRLPACNEAIIDQEGQCVVGRRRTPPSSPLQFSQPDNPPILLFVRLIFQSQWYKFSTPNFPLTKEGS